jgi:hypothetical protein
MRKLDIHDVAGLVKYAIKRDLADVRAEHAGSLSKRVKCPNCATLRAFPAHRRVVRLDPS